MTKIKKIEFKNYRAFYGTYPDIQSTILDTQNTISATHNTINLPTGENALIYGENGSGKSSVYQGLKDFFNAANNTIVLENSPKHLKVSEEENYEVKITFDNQTEVSFDNGGNITEPFLLDTFKLNSFLSYKELLRTHLLEQGEFSEKFFTLVLYTLLKNRSYGSNSTIEKKLAEITTNSFLRGVSSQNQADTQLVAFNIFWMAEIQKIEAATQAIMSYFNSGVAIKFMPKPLSKTDLKEGEKVRGSLDLEISYLGETGIPHLEILNEARLSALAISIFLASIITNPINTSAEYKILFLDDIFIGLDMSNRLPLLDILKKFPKIRYSEVSRSYKEVRAKNGKIEEYFFSDYQIFMTTYDKAWFEVAKKHLPKWQTIQMYVGKNEQENFEYPLIISPSLNYYQQAKIYANRNQDSKYKDKYLDYAAAGNYLRKEVEAFLKEYLLGKNRLKKDGEKIIYKTQLGELWDSFKIQMGIMGFKLDDFEDFDILSKAVFNPFSHDNLDKPIYKIELDMAFDFVDKLHRLSKKVLFEQGKKVFLNIAESSGDIRIFEFEAVDKVYVFQQIKTTTSKRTYLSSQFNSMGYTKNGIFISHTQTYTEKISKLFDMAYYGTLTVRNASQTRDIYQELKDATDRTLEDLINALP